MTTQDSQSATAPRPISAAHPGYLCKKNLPWDYCTKPEAPDPETCPDSYRECPYHQTFNQAYDHLRAVDDIYAAPPPVPDTVTADPKKANQKPVCKPPVQNPAQASMSI